MGDRRRALVMTLIAAALAPAGGGCAARHMIVAATGTNIGVEVSQNPANQSPQAKLGYQRTEFAIVPTNRSAKEETDGGAQEHGDVIMELRYGGIFDTGKSSGIYQRLAVGRNGVAQPGAALMFARDADGAVSDNTAKAALEALKTVPQRDSALKARVAKIARLRSCHEEAVDKAIQESGLQSFDNLADFNFTETQLEAVESKVSSLPECS
jgi:hypothetical protein